MERMRSIELKKHFAVKRNRKTKIFSALLGLEPRLFTPRSMLYPWVAVFLQKLPANP